MSKLHMSICLLVCGSSTGKVNAEHGEYTDIFHRFLEAALPSGSAIRFRLDPYDVVEKMEYPSEDKVDHYDGIIITGSPAAAYEDIEWINKLVAFTKTIAETKSHIKLIGICFGHQIISRALGGECVPNGGKWEVGPTPLALTSLGKQIFGVDSLNIQEMHHDHVPTIVPGFHLLASTSISPNQGMVRFLDSSTSIPPPSKLIPSIQILTIQGHPEFTERIILGLLEQRTTSGVIDAETAEDVEKRIGWRNDGVSVVGKVVWGVLGVA